MVFGEHTFQCSGCKKEKKGFGFGPFPLRLRDDTHIEKGFATYYSFCNIECLKKWAQEQPVTPPKKGEGSEI